jgi:hypothetical protein
MQAGKAKALQKCHPAIAQHPWYARPNRLYILKSRISFLDLLSKKQSKESLLNLAPSPTLVQDPNAEITENPNENFGVSVLRLHEFRHRMITIVASAKPWPSTYSG